MTSKRPIRLLLPCPAWKEGKAWGDFYFGQSLGDAFERLGYQVRYSYRPKHFLGRLASQIRRLVHWRETELVIRGRQTWRPLPGKRAWMWLISNSNTVAPSELRRFAHVFIASEKYMERVQNPETSTSVLLQCTDGQRFGPREVPGTQPCLFVGNRRKDAPRMVVQATLDAGHEVEVWGRGWSGNLSPERLAGEHIKNSELPDHYKSACAVLNDHTAAMLADGFVSNRVFDVAACATPLITEEMSGIPDEMRPHLFLYSSLGEVHDALQKALNAGASGEADRVELARRVLREHTFDQRAEEILRVIASST